MVLALLLVFPPFLSGNEVSPQGGMEQEKEREERQSAGKHIKHEYIFGKGGKHPEIVGWSNHFQSWSNVIDGGRNGSEVGYEIPALEGNEEDRGGE